MLSMRYLSLSVVVAVVSSTATAQISGTPSSAARLAPIDASALGVTRDASVGVAANDADFVLEAGVGIAGGSLRGLLGLSDDWSLGAGYARTFAATEAIHGIHSSIGAELVAGFRYGHYGPRNDGALHLTIPAALTFGDPNRPLIKGPTLALYAAPYAEIGSAYIYRSYQCAPGSCSLYEIQHKLAAATGLGVGGRLSFGRFAADVIIRDFLASNYTGRRTMRDLELGIGYRLGQ